MKLAIKLYAWLLFLLYSYTSFGQVEQYDYKRELKGISGPWHKIVLPNEIFGKVSQDLSDIRIFGITAASDTIESPYLLRQTVEEISSKEVAFKTLNASRNEKGYFYTFEIPTTEAINQIKLEFKQQNFDWRLRLEGSQNQQEWFTIVEDYRILSINTELTDFEFTKLSFQNSIYQFFRLFIDSKEKPDLTDASIAQYEISDGTYRNYTIKKTLVNENKQLKQTEIDIELQLPVPISKINFGVSYAFDFYRPITIQYLVDSFKTEQGWKYNYSTLATGTLNSMEENDFKFNSRTIQKLKILIHNQDNQALTIDSIEVKGYVHELVARFNEPAIYFLAYGSSNTISPTYDINRFTDKIPENLIALEIGEEKAIVKEKIPETTPLFQNKNWLWAIMAVLILLLGWFSVKMMQKKE
jgi:hypothetical protein